MTNNSKNEQVTYSVESIVCDYAVYRHYKDDTSLICICNSHANALLIRAILSADQNHEIYGSFNSVDACLGKLMGAIDSAYHPHNLILRTSPDTCITISGLGRISKPSSNESDMLRQISHKSGYSKIHLIRKIGFITLWDYEIN